MVVVELLLNKCAPAGLVFQEPEQIITLGVIVAKTLLDLSIPVLVLKPEDFQSLKDHKYAAITGPTLQTGENPLPPPTYEARASPPSTTVHLSETDQEILGGAHGAAPQKAMEILLSFAQIQGATRLIDVSRAHIDACIYTGPASLRIPQTFLSLGARVAIPTTLNSISIDRRRWKEIGIKEELAIPADQLAETYLAMGAQPVFTCAPYLLESPPEAGQDIGWAESNAVVFANSVLGARTQKYPDLVDVCIALTGRAPLAGGHADEGRTPSVVVEVADLPKFDDAVWPLLGYQIGQLAEADIPLIVGLEQTKPSISDLKAFGAAFATTASASMFHIQGVTPEAIKFEGIQQTAKRMVMHESDLVQTWEDLNTAKGSSVGLISLGNPHFSLEEFESLSRLCADRKKDPSVQMIITTGRETYQLAAREGYIQTLEAFGATIITDTCWCMIQEPVIPPQTTNLMTNSAKYAHYAPGMVQRGVHFGSLAQCVLASCTGYFDGGPSWKQD
jgi:predicted aconitase